MSGTVSSFENGKYYETTGPSGEKCVIMTEATWLNYGTLLQSFRNIASNQDRRIKELLAENKILTAQHVDTRNRLENLRAVRRAEKRPEVEAMIDFPPANRGN